MAFQILLFLFLSLSTSPVQSHSSTSSILINPLTTTTKLAVTDFGAVGDGVHYDTAAIQSAIDACIPSAPCVVRFPSPGNYLTRTIRLKSGVVLEVEEGATLLGGTRMVDYPEEQSRWYVILAENASDVGITGGGVVDGQGLEFVKRFDKKKNVMVSWNQTGACLGDECRPRLVGFIGCKNVRLWNLSLSQPAYWWCVIFSFLSPLIQLFYYSLLL